MKTAPNTHIYDRWATGGPFVGSQGRPHGRVTVEIGWQLRETVIGSDGKYHLGTYNRGPVRWFQRSDNSQTETEIPNIMSIDIDRSIDNPAATLKLVMLNQKMLPNGQVVTGTAGESVGQPGYYLPTRGDSAESSSRWGWSTNEWNDVLQPNALIRTYQGYGGNSKTIAQALSDGNITQTGLWLVDDVSMDAATGNLAINCRDMVKLLIEQQLYPPLVPTVGDAHYPLNYYKWVYVNHQVIPYGNTIYKTGYTEIENDSVVVHVSSSASGHPGSDAIDGTDPDTYWLSGGHITGGGNTDYEYIELDVGTTIEGFNLQTYGGNYKVYASVLVGGVWQGALTIPTSVGGMNIKYVTEVGVGWESAAQFQLGAPYAATKLRLTFTHLTKTSIGPNYYRCGIRDLTYGTFSGTVTGGGRTIKGISRGYSSKNNGYWLAGSDGGVFTFGSLKFFGSEGGSILAAPITGIAGDNLGLGYRLCAADGGVFAFGNLPYKGSLPGLGISTIRVIGIEHYAHDGYYLIDNLGEVFAFGSAPYHGNFSGADPGGSVVGMAVCPSGGYWIADKYGAVQNFGGAPPHGGASPATPITAIEADSGFQPGDGYWLVAEDGAVYAKGSATYHGGMNGTPLNGIITDMSATGDNGGYWLVGEDGGVFSFGDAQFSGSLPEQFARVEDGNYGDYLDIIKDLLLWSGWWFFNPAFNPNTNTFPPAVFGNLETTGIYAPENLTEDFFDKKPVIDVINTLKEITGYVAYCDEIGAFQYKTPNVWSIGNFLDTGAPTALIPSIDESLQVTAYQVDMNDTDARSTITISTADPDAHFADTKSVTITSQWGPSVLRGIVRPALWVNGQFLTKEIQTTMANLIDLHLFMAQRQGNLTMPANPMLQIDDQIRIFERSTSETYIHYLRGYSSHMDMESGEYTMTLQTHWLGDGTAWFLIY